MGRDWTLCDHPKREEIHAPSSSALYVPPGTL